MQFIPGLLGLASQNTRKSRAVGQQISACSHVDMLLPELAVQLEGDRCKHPLPVGEAQKRWNMQDPAQPGVLVRSVAQHVSQQPDEDSNTGDA